MTTHPKPVMIAPSTSAAAHSFDLLMQTRGATISDMYEARTVIEPACARLLALHRSEADLAGLRAGIEKLRRHLDDDVVDPLRWSVLTYRFHQHVFDGTGSESLALLGAVMEEIAVRHIASSINRSRDRQATLRRCQLLIRSYTRLVDLVQASDADGAEAHWRAHMEAGARTLVDGFPLQAVIDLFRESIPSGPAQPDEVPGLSSPG
jgi:GntR family transcriptional regulator, transcriptional repressor for pyruvate dehydrogenase complex